MKQRIFESNQVDGGTFRFLAESKELAIDHQMCLNMAPLDPRFPELTGTPKQVGWTEDVAGLDLDDERTWV